MNEYSLTPVQEVDGLRIKRDDLYAPFGPGEVNGGKLRQCVMLVNSVKKDYKSLLTYCSIHSPQAPITAAVARANGMPCRIVYGGTTRESVAALPMPRLAMKYGASIVLAARSGRHSILHARAKELAAQENSFIVQYGINIIGYGDTLLTAVAAQTEFLSTPSARRATAKTETKSLFSNKLYNILHEFRRALIYNGSKNYPNHAK